MPCLNDAKCMDLEVQTEGSGSGAGSGMVEGLGDVIEAYQCVCRPGFQGKLCESSRCPNRYFVLNTYDVHRAFFENV